MRNCVGSETVHSPKLTNGVNRRSTRRVQLTASDSFGATTSMKIRKTAGASSSTSTPTDAAKGTPDRTPTHELRSLVSAEMMP